MKPGPSMLDLGKPQAVAAVWAVVLLTAASPSSARHVLATSGTTHALLACGQPLSDGEKPTAADCLFILKVAVGSESCAPACTCDVNGDLAATASDALVCLRSAVGLEVALQCPCDAATTTTSSTSTTIERRGACCTRSARAVCVITTPHLCEASGGVYLGDTERRCTAEQVAACAEITVTTTAPDATTTTTTTTSSLPQTTTTVPDFGSCCVGGGCIIVARQECEGVYHGSPTCSDVACAIAPMPAPPPSTTTTVPPGGVGALLRRR